MADPAWGSTSSLSDEETARALCAFHHTEPLPTQRRRPLQQQQKKQKQPTAPLYQPRNNHDGKQSQFAPNDRVSNGFSTFGYPVPTRFHLVPMSAQRSEATSMLVGMPSTSSDDWHRQQQRAIQEQIEQQQRELQAQLYHQQQREMQMEVQRMQAQIQQQEHAQRYQMQIQRHVENTQQPSYSSGVSGFEQLRWTNEVQTSQATRTASNFHDGRRREGTGVQRQQSGQPYDGRFGQLSARPTTASVSMPSFMPSYNDRLQTGTPMSRSQDTFASQQAPQPAQSHLQARNPEIFSVSGHEWGRHDPTLFGGAQTDRIPTFQMQRSQQFVPLQPEPYEIPNRIRQESGPMLSSNNSRPDEFALDSIMKHFQTNAGPSPGASATSTGATYDPNAGHTANRNIKPVFNPTMSQTRTQTSKGIQTQGQLNSQSKVPVPPTGAAVVPGIALAPQSMRLLTMRDLLNGDDGSIRMDSSRNRPRISRQKRTPTNRKLPRKNTAAKRQRTPQQQNERKFQPPLTNKRAEAKQSRQAASPAPVGTSGPATKLPTPMYLAFMESRAARALEQTVSNTNFTRTASSLPPESQQLSPASRSATSSVSQGSDQAVASTSAGVDSVKRKKVDDGPPGIYHPSSLYQHHHLPSASASLQAAAHKESPDPPQPNAVEAFNMKSECHGLVNGQDRPSDGACSRQQNRPKLFVPKKLECNVQVGGCENSKAGTSSRKRPRAKLPVAGLKSSIGNGSQLLAPSTQVSNEAAATADTSSAVMQTPVASAVPRSENRTVVIFCKRDFMRYQAAKIWRKYQEQLKKHEEWREVRVAGKRTRYLNSRYDELQRTHKRTYTRSGKPRRKAPQAAKVGRRRKALISGDSAPVGSTVSSSMSVDHVIDTREPRQTGNEGLAEAGANSNHSKTVDAGVADNDCPMTVQDASEAQEEPSTIEEETRSIVESSVCKDSDNGVVADSTNRILDDTASGIAANDGAVAVAPLCDDSEAASLPAKSPGNVDSSVSDAPDEGGAEAGGATPVSNITTAVAKASLNGSAEPGSVSNGAIEASVSDINIVTVAAPSKGTVEVIGVAPDESMDNTVAKTASVESVATNTTFERDLDTDVKMSGDTEEYSRNDNARACGERSSPLPVEKDLPTLQQSTSTSTTEDNNSCADSIVQDGIPPEQQSCPAPATSNGDGGVMDTNSDKQASSDGMALNTDAIKPEKSLRDIQSADETLPDKITDTEPAMITPNGLATVEAKQHCTESTPVHNVPDMPVCTDPSNGATAISSDQQ
ncbi:hypothetical protein L914_09310 [Phytophthora nicotianae]|uniref:Uncharacterized protein n=1 Tax=Phytophthora nicotianae TaxID=4792 RepID=W2NAR3_PHYNI|nr:hypothetical protein L914_09310 [Phytophthora nicotianae]